MSVAAPANPTIANADAMVRLHLSESWDGPGPDVIDALVRELARVHRYPDPGCAELRAELAAASRVDASQVLVGNGTDEVLLLLALALLGPGRVAVTTERTFPGYRTVTETSGATARLVPLDGYRVDVAALEAELAARPDLLFLCNPHNPTGSALDADDVARLAWACEAAGTLLVCDEAYVEFAPGSVRSAADLLRAGRRVVVLRTFSKWLALAGLRVGYCLAPPDVIARVEVVKAALPFSVNRLAQVTAMVSLRAGADPDARRRRVAGARAHLCRILDDLDVAYVPSSTNFVLARLPDGLATDVAGELAREHGILVRDTAPFGLPGHIRVGLGSHEQLDLFGRALAGLLAGRPTTRVEES